MQQNPLDKPIKVEEDPSASSSKRPKFDSRGRNVLATVAEVDGKICFVCGICDGDFVGFDNFQIHLALHRLLPKFERAQSTRQPDVEYINLISSDEEDVSNGQVSNQQEQSLSDKTAARTRGVRPSSNATKVGAQQHVENRRRPNDNRSKPADEIPSKKRRNDQADTFNCKHCGEEFATVLEINRHRSDCDEWDKRFHPCGICTEKFPTQKAKRQHQLVQHQEELPEKCRICRVTRLFATKEELRQHEIDQHITGVVFQCHFCDKLFSSSYEKNQHVKEHHPFGEYECRKCGKTLKTKDAMDEHYELVHKKRSEVLS